MQNVTEAYSFDDDEWSYEEPYIRPDGKTEVEILNEIAPCNHYHLHCVWDVREQTWICDGVEHKYVEALHLGQEVDKDPTTYCLDDSLGWLIRVAHGVTKERISDAEAIRTSPEVLRDLSKDTKG